MRFINPDCCKSLRFESITLLKNNRTWTKKEFCDGFITSCPSFQNLIELEHFFLWSNLITIYIIFNYFLWTNAWKLLEEHYSMPSCPAVAVLHVQELITDPLQEFQKLPNSSYFDANTGFESLVWRKWYRWIWILWSLGFFGFRISNLVVFWSTNSQHNNEIVTVELCTSIHRLPYWQ